MQLTPNKHVFNTFYSVKYDPNDNDHPLAEYAYYNAIWRSVRFADYLIEKIEKIK